MQAKKKDKLDQYDKNPKFLSYFMLFYHWSSHVQRSAIIKSKISELRGTFLETAVSTTPLSCLKSFKPEIQIPSYRAQPSLLAFSFISEQDDFMVSQVYSSPHPTQKLHLSKSC